MQNIRSSHIMRVILQLLLKVFLYCIASRAELDKWAHLNNGGSVTKLAVNSDALYAIADNGSFTVLQKNGVFRHVDKETVDLDVDGDFGVWIVKNNSVFFREGVDSANLVGNDWKEVPASAKRVTSGRYGLVLIANVDAQVHSRSGITANDRFGSSWVFANGFNVTRLSCGNRVCLMANEKSFLLSTGLLEDTDSPNILQWLPIDSDVNDVSAYGQDTLWKIDKSGVAWKAREFDPNFFHVSWKRYSYHAAFKDIAVTDQIHFAISSDKFIKVLTGCPIFDFEDNDISLWTAEGDAFRKQPVVGQEFAYGRKSGKFDDRFIDTYSSRTTYDETEGAVNASQGDNCTGTLKSPLFQIRNDMLHFAIGGGSHPTNYVGLYVQDIEVMRSSGESVDRTGPNGKVRSSRHWWDVKAHKGMCAYVKIIDIGRGIFGHTIFDDLRASPPCFKSMEVKLVHVGDRTIASVGQLVEYKLHLSGFYTSETRKLTVNVSYPITGHSPYIYIENIDKHWVKCASDFTLKRHSRSSPSLSRHWYSMSATIGNYVLSDITLKLIIRIYDHYELQVNTKKSIVWTTRVDFAGEYLHKIVQQVNITRLGNETAKLRVFEGITANNKIFVGDSIKYLVSLRHDYKESLQRAYNIMIRLFVPPFMSLTNVYGLDTTHGEQQFSPSPSQFVVHIPELLLGDKRHVNFVLRIDGNPAWGRKHLRKTEGQIIVDEISYCKRKACGNALGNGTEIVSLLRYKARNFEFYYRKEEIDSLNQVFSKISNSNGSIVIICGPYMKNEAGRCYYGNFSIWYKLNPILSNVTFYNSVKQEIFGVSWLKNKIKLFGDYFNSVQFLSDDQWEATSRIGLNIVTPTNFYNSSEVSKEINRQGKLWTMWRCCR